MASVLLLYYHILDEGGFVHNQTVNIDSNKYCGFDYLGVEVREPPGESLDLNENLIREGQSALAVSLI